MVSEAAKSFIEHRREIASRKHAFPDRQELVGRNPWFHPEDRVTSKMLDQLEQYSGQSLNALEIANAIISSFNALLTGEELNQMEYTIQFALLGTYARKITDDEQVNRMVQQTVLDAQDGRG